MGKTNYVVDQSNLTELELELEARLARALKRTLEGYIEAGRVLLEAKQRLPHGSWQPWLQRVGLSQPQAWRYMRVAKEQNHSLPNDLSLERAVAMLSDAEEDGEGQHGRVIPLFNNLESSDSWYTPAPIIEVARAAMGGIDLDPASSTEANEVVRAKEFFTEEDNGLKRDWWGRVWLNPPYGRDDDHASKAGIWTSYLVEQYEQGSVTEATLLVNSKTDTLWWAPLWVVGTICFLSERVVFGTPGGSKPASPVHASALVYMGRKPKRFIKYASKLGAVVRRVDS